MFFSHQNPRKNTNDLLELVDQGILDPLVVLKSALSWMSDQEVLLDPLVVLKSALSWMSDQEVLEFANANQFFLDDDDEEDDQ